MKGFPGMRVESVHIRPRNFLTSVGQEKCPNGTTTEEELSLNFDRTTMSQDDIENGRIICYVGIAPVKPPEFVIFRFSQKTIEASCHSSAIP